MRGKTAEPTEFRHADHSKGDPRRWLALPVLLTEGREAEWPAWIAAVLVASPLVLVASIRFEGRLSARGGDPLVAIHLLRNSGFVIGLGGVLSLRLPVERRATDMPQPARKAS